MNKLLAALAITTCIVATSPANAADVSAETKTSVKQDEDGSMKKTTTSESTDANGTTMKSEAETKVDVNSDGTAEKSTTVEKSSDPKGLMNKSSEKVETKVDKHGKKTVKHKKVVDGKTVENTKSESPAQ